MNPVKNRIPDVEFTLLNKQADLRGSFVKTFDYNVQGVNNFLNIDIKEEFYSISDKNVIRGMHFQIPPFQQAKIVYCPVGAVLDVLLDLRIGPSYGKVNTFTLDAEVPSILYIPAGIAHGFLSLKKNSCLVYKCDQAYNSEHDFGIRWDSFGYEWGVENPIMSQRDASHELFKTFVTPF
jgi:dTDP-4-dehydrorhamnose 3,5-epimerase